MMTTALDLNNREADARDEESGTEAISLWKLPKLVWAGMALFSMNLIIGTGMLETPDVQTDVYGKEVTTVYAQPVKPSPFTEMVDTTKHKVRTAAKLYPAAFVSAPVEQDMPVQAEPALYTTGMQSIGRIPAIYSPNELDMTPPRTSETDSRFVVTN